MPKFVFMNHRTHGRLLVEGKSVHSAVTAHADGRLPRYYQYKEMLVITAPMLPDGEFTKISDDVRAWIVGHFQARGYDVPEEFQCVSGQSCQPSAVTSRSR